MVKIIVHEGNAHLDEFLSACIVIYNEGDINIIYRRSPTLDELNNSIDWKIDIGKKFSPSKRQFDHHLSVFLKTELLPYNVNTLSDCSFSLLLKHYGVWEKALEVYKWLPVVVMLDVRGTKVTEEQFGISRYAITSLDSFVERSILDIFERKKVIEKKSFLFQLMKFIGKLFFHKIDEYFKMYKTANKHAEIYSVNGVPIIKYLYKTYYSDQLIRVLGIIKRDSFPYDKGGIAILPNKRPKGSIGLKRFNDDNRVDFRRIKDYEKVVYVHHNGFFAVIENICDDKLAVYIEDSIK